MFLHSLLTNKGSYNAQIIQCVNDTTFKKRFRVPGFGTGSGTLEPVPWNRFLRQITTHNVTAYEQWTGQLTTTLDAGDYIDSELLLCAAETPIIELVACRRHLCGALSVGARTSRYKSIMYMLYTPVTCL